MTEKAVKLCSKLYEARDSMRGLFGENYQAKVAEYQVYIRAEMRKTGAEILPALMAIVKDLQAKVPDCGMACAILCAAAVEMIEPRK